MKCLRCNRPLKDPESVKRGYGPICWAMVQPELENEMDKTEDQTANVLAEPLDEYIVMRRDEHGVMTNVPHLITHHSPTGFEFGYGGSGPADLALNILEVVLRMTGYKGAATRDTWKGDKCFRLAYQLHQPFKWEFIAKVPREGGKIYTNDIVAWIEANKVPSEPDEVEL